MGSPDDPTVQNFLATVTMPAEDIVSFVPLGPDEEWTVRMLRHKIRKAYFINDPDSQRGGKVLSKYLVTISAVREYEIKREDLKSCDTTEVGPGDAIGRIELEVSTQQSAATVRCYFGLQIFIFPFQSFTT